jgi:hypothetical protein
VPLSTAVLTALRRQRGGSPAAAARGSGFPGVAIIPEAPDARVSVEVAWSADLTASPDAWTWTNVTPKVRQSPGITTRLGRNDESSDTNPAELSIVLDNTTGAFSLGGRSPNYPYVRRNVPVRVRVDPGTGARVLFLGFAAEWTPGWDSLTGNIPVVTLKASGTLRRLSQGDDPVISPARRYLLNLPYVVSYWPCDEGKYANVFPPAIGSYDMSWSGTPSLASNSDFDSSLPIPEVDTSDWIGVVDSYTAGGDFGGQASSVRAFMVLPDTGPASTFAQMIKVTMYGGTAGSFVLYYSNAASGGLGVRAFNAAGATLGDTGIMATGLNGLALMVQFTVYASGGNIFAKIGAAYGNRSAYFDTTAVSIFAGTIGIINSIRVNEFRENPDLAVGHVAVIAGSPALSASIYMTSSYDGEAVTGTGGRLARVTTENAVPFELYGGSSETLTFADYAGPQPIDTVVNILRDCEKLERGVLWDGLDPGLAYTTRRRFENATPAITLDANAGELAPPFEPTDDDQASRNRWTVNRQDGAEFTVSDVTGPMGTRAIGVYSDSLTVNSYQDRGARDIADWLVHRGTVVGYRYPTVTVDLRAVPRLVPLVLGLIVGSRIDLVNVDDALDTATTGTVSLTVEGISHNIRPGSSWTVELNCSPFDQWRVAVIAAETGDLDEDSVRLDAGPGDSTVAALTTAGATSLSVATVATGALWTTAADDFPFYVDVGGEPVRVTAISGATSPQTFTVDALEVDRHVGDAVTVLNPNVLGL